MIMTFITLIPHANLQGGAAFAVFLAVFLFALVAYGIYLTFGAGKEGLRDEMEEHARLHEKGIAHRHD
tara:strand:- start:318 stop:521 length:204 start_codon:yes stop_codon:yes gene_type:complete